MERLNFWFVHNNRFTNIKAKIFLRRDLYNSNVLQFVDASKMRAYHLELKWDKISLYRLLVKRLANSGSEVTLKYLMDVPGLLLKQKDELGYLPCDSEEVLQMFTDKIIGRYMGKTMLMDKEEFLTYLEPEKWPEDKRLELPGRSKEEIYDALLTLGIIMEMPDDRVNVPEIYLYGFGLKRKGGIKRPK